MTPCFGLSSTSFIRTLAVWALFLAIALPALSHQVAVVPVRNPAKDSVLPMVLPGAHLALSPAVLDFGEVAVGQSVTLTVELSNISGEGLNIAADAEAPFSVAPLGPIALPMGAPPLVLSVTVTPDIAGDFAGLLVIASEHDGVFTPVLQTVPLSVAARTPPNLVFSIPDEQLFDIDGYDFGFLSLRAYPLAETPLFRVTIRNQGTPGVTQTARNVRFAVGGVGANLPGLGSCNQNILASDVCVSFDDDGPVDGVAFDLAPAEEIGLLFRFLPLAPAWLDKTFAVTAINASDQAFTVTGGVVPFSFESGAFLQPADTGQEMSSAPDFGVATDPLGPNPFATFEPTGFDPRTVFSIGEVDAVDARTGNVVLTIPLGGAQKARGTLEYTLNLVVNTRIWKRWQVATLRPPNPDDMFPDPQDRFDIVTTEYPNPLYNITAGVSLHMGRLIPSTELSATGPWRSVFPVPGVPDVLAYEHVVQTGPRIVYVDPSGAEHELYRELHGDEPQGSGNAYLNARALYSRDGSFLRLVFDPAVPNHRWIESGDGLRRLFVKQSSPQPTLRDQWLLTEIHDRSGNQVSITYGPDSWTIRDNGDADGFRQTRVLFQDPEFPTLATEVQLRDFGGGTRTFVLEYAAPGPQGVPRPETSAYHDEVAIFHPEVDVNVHLPTLARVILPDSRATFELDWGYIDEHNPLALLAYEMPTGARVVYDYGRSWNNTPNCVNRGLVDRVVGVTRRTVYDAGGTHVLADKRFLREVRRVPELVPDHPCPNDTVSPAPHAEQRIAVWTDHERSGASFDGLSSVELHYYSIYPLDWSTGNATGFGYVERNIPVSKAESDGGRYISRRSYACDFDLASGPPVAIHLGDGGDSVGNVIDDLLPPDDCELRESTFARYEVEQAGYCRPTLLQFCLRDSRLLEQRTYYGNDGGGDKWIGTVNSDYDGLGHYRTSEVSSNFQSTGDLQQRTYQGFNPEVENLELRPDHTVIGNWSLPQGFDWLLELWDEQWVEDGSGWRMGGEARFDVDGRIELERTWKDDSRGGRDIVVSHAYDAHGQRIRQSFFGADTYGGDVPTSASWDSPSHWTADMEDFSVVFDYDKGVLTEQRVSGESVFEVHRTVDEGTGWTIKDFLSSGEELTYDYDAMGRVTEIISTETANRIFSYDQAPSGSWSLAAKTFGNGVVTGTPIRTYDAEVDGLGRMTEEEIPGYDGGVVRRRTGYHPSGQVDYFTSLDNPQRKTHFEWDISGKLRKRRNPDNLATGSNVGLTVINYTGVRREKIRTWVHAASDPASLPTTSEALAETIVERDGLGRVITATLPEGAVTSYSYDPLGNVTRARRGGQSGQVRVWGTDGRGFTTSESIPERSVTSVFSELNTRGQAARLQEGGRITRFVYDDLGRMTRVRVDDRLVKRFDFGISGPANGQLTHAERHNYRDGETSGLEGHSGNWKVFSDFAYDSAGRLDDRTTKVRFDFDAGGDTGWMTFNQSWQYDDLGNVTRIDYPERTGFGGGRTVDLDYAKGFYLTGVSTSHGLGVDLTYHPSGLVHQIRHPSPTGWDTYRVTEGGVAGGTPTGVPRWSRMHLAGGDLDLALAYDPAGNVTRVGGDLFGYDGNHRLTAASLAALPAAERLVAYGYDIYDNHTLGMGAVDVATNQLVGGVTYDVFGNLDGIDQQWIEATLVHDGLDKLAALHLGGPPSDPGHEYSQLQVYDHGDLRIMKLNHHQPGAEVTWTLRGLGGEVLTEFEDTGSDMRHAKDFVYADSRLVASRDAQTGEVCRYHNDHLGSARYVSVVGNPADSHAIHYRPFGADIESSGDPRVGFTGHENDGITTYMRARTYLPLAARFLEVDPGRDMAAWSQYALVGNNPLSFVDLSGLERVAYYLATGDLLDPFRHSAVYISESGELDGSGTVFSHGGLTTGVPDLSEYLRIEEYNGEETVAYPLNLNEEQVDGLEAAFLDPNVGGFERQPNGNFKTTNYESLTNNCAQCAYRSIRSVAEPNPVREIAGEIALGIQPPTFTTQAITALKIMGIIDLTARAKLESSQLGDDEDELDE